MFFNIIVIKNQQFERQTQMLHDKVELVLLLEMRQFLPRTELQLHFKRIIRRLVVKFRTLFLAVE